MLCTKCTFYTLQAFNGTECNACNAILHCQVMSRCHKVQFKTKLYLMEKLHGKKKATPKCFSSCWKIIWCDTFKWTLFLWNLFHFMQLEESCRLFVFQNVHTVQYFTNEYCTILFNFIVSRCQQKSQSYISLNFYKLNQNSLHGWISTGSQEYVLSYGWTNSLSKCKIWRKFMFGDNNLPPSLTC